MSEEQKWAAMVNANVACALIELEAMKAANHEREIRGDSPAYGEEAFRALIEQHGIHTNAVVRTLSGFTVGLEVADAE